MAKYIVSGKIGRGKAMRPFEKQVESPSEKLAKEKVYALFGSNAGLKRSAVSIESVSKI
ncbi:MAG: 50S ribosomal protein L18Ae [Candidatus Micrarchaeia archaeon]